MIGTDPEARRVVLNAGAIQNAPVGLAAPLEQVNGLLEAESVHIGEGL